MILLRTEDFTDSERVAVRDGRSRHIRHVLRANVGDRLRVGLLGGKRGSGIVTAMNETGIELQISLTDAPPAKLPLTLLLALPRPKVARRIVRAATELGVGEIILLNSYRVEKSYWQSPLVDDAHLQAAIAEGLAQSGDTVPPGLQRHRLFKPFVEDSLPLLLHARHGLVAHPYADTTRSTPSAPRPTLLAIGPEGGFIPYEYDKLLAAGMTGLSLGQRIFTVETALPTLVGKLFY